MTKYDFSKVNQILLNTVNERLQLFEFSIENSRKMGVLMTKITQYIIDWKLAAVASIKLQKINGEIRQIDKLINE